MPVMWPHLLRQQVPSSTSDDATVMPVYGIRPAWCKSELAQGGDEQEMVYTDGKHLIADSLCELHVFALHMGLRREWFQGHHHPHYDLTTRRAVLRAINLGAELITSRQVIVISRAAHEPRQ